MHRQGTLAQETQRTTHKPKHNTNANTTQKNANTPSWPCFPLQPQAQPQILKTTVEMQNSDWSKILVPRGTTGNFLIFLKIATDHVWAAPAS